MKNILSIGIVGLLLLSACGALASPPSTTESDDNNATNNVLTHTVFAEDATATWCTFCHFAHTALKNIYNSGDFPFYYTTLVDDKNTHAAARINEYNLYGFPTVFFDGGNKVNVGGGSGNEAQYRSSITSTGNRAVKNIDVTLNVAWLGGAAMNINVSVQNNEATQYSGRIRVYVTELGSTMGWKDTSGKVYTFAFLDYAFNQVLSIAPSAAWTASAVWDGDNYNDGYGHTFGGIQYGNIMVIATVFNSEWHQGYAYPPSQNPFDAYWVDDTAGFRVGNNTPPKTPSAPNPSNGSTNVDIHKTLSWTGGDVNPFDILTYDVYFGTTNPPVKVASNVSAATYNPGTLGYATTYYWKIVCWDNHGGSTAGPVWQFTTGSVPNNPPNTPEISGPATGKPGKSIVYTFTATDSDGDAVFFFVDWGDNTTTDWDGPYASGEEASIAHTWAEKGDYTIKAKAKDPAGAESDWGTMDISIPISLVFPHFNFFEFLQRILERFPLLERLLLH